MDAKTPSSGRRKPHEVLVDSRCRFAFGRRLVFISHSSKDNSIAETICNQLESAGIRCWIAPRDIQVGSDWTRGIMQGIARCRVFVLVFTDHANDSEHVGREVANAFSLGLAVIPFRIEAVNPRDNLAYFLETVQWFDAITPPLHCLAGPMEMNLALVYAWTNEPDLAFEKLSSLTKVPSLLFYGQLKRDPEWEPLRQDPRHEKLLAELALPDR